MVFARARLCLPVALLLVSALALAQGGTTSSDIYPANTGQNLGIDGYRWNLYAQNIDFAGTFSGAGTWSGLQNFGGGITGTGNTGTLLPGTGILGTANTWSAQQNFGTLSVSNNVSGGVGTAAGGGLNIQKATSPAAIFMGRAVDVYGNTNAQLLGFNVEQMVNPTSSVSYQNSAYTGELFIPIGNTQNFTGNQVAADFAAINYGSGTFSGNVLTGVVGETWNSGPATSILEMDGISGGCHNGSVTAGIPPQTPTGNGSVSNCRGVVASVSNSSTGTITNAEGVLINAATNTGGGTITTAYGLHIGDETHGVTNYAIKTGAGLVSFGDAVSTTNTMTATGGSGTGAAAFGTSGLLSLATVFIGGSTATTGTSQDGLLIAPTLGGTTASNGIAVRADVPASTTIAKNIGIDIAAPVINSGGVITEWDGLRIEQAPTATTKCSLVLSGSTSGATCINPAAAAGSTTITYPAATGTVGLVITGTSAAFATATTAGTCVQSTTAVTGATTAMTVSVSPVSTPGVGAQWSAFVSSAGNVTINECAVAASAGGTIAFNIRVIQ